MDPFMILSIPIHRFEINNVHFLEPKKNVNMNGSFIKMNYSENDISLNAIYITYSLQRLQPIENTSILQRLHQMENEILDLYKNSRKIQKTNTLSLLPHLMAQSKNIELCDEKTWFSNYQTNVIKISGIWETESMIGITYRMIHT
jgi:hypothetical protein